MELDDNLTIYGHHRTAIMGRNAGIGITTPNATAQLDVSITTTDFLPSRMTTTERDAISSPVDGLVIFNSPINCLQVKSSPGWFSLATPSTTAVFFAYKSISPPPVKNGVHSRKAI